MIAASPKHDMADDCNNKLKVDARDDIMSGLVVSCSTAIAPQVCRLSQAAREVVQDPAVYYGMLCGICFDQKCLLAASHTLFIICAWGRKYVYEYHICIYVALANLDHP